MRVLIVDDHTLMRRGLAHIVKERFPDADVVEAEGASAALDVLREEGADLALIDVHTPGRGGLEALRVVKLERPDVPVIVVSIFESAPDVRRALSDGAAGYLMKDATPEDLAQAINAATSGGVDLLSGRAIQTLLESLAAPSGDPSGPSGQRLTDYRLTPREHEILVLLCEGRSNRSIAQDLYLSDKTVKAHIAAVFRKLGVTNRTQAAMMAMQLGAGPVPEATPGDPS